MTTGVNPGKHGIYYFYNFSKSPPSIINSSDTTIPRIWDLVGAAGGRSIVVNVPVTYPATRTSGVLVSGIPPWFVDERSVYPSSLMAKLKASGYEIDAPMGRRLERDGEALVTRLVETERRRVDLFLDLAGEERWSFGMIVLTALDRMQHHLLGGGSSAERAVERGYAELDALIGRIADALGPEVNYIVASDHGFNERPVAFYPNSWLRERGFLLTRSSFRNRVTVAAHNLLDGRFLWAPKSVTKRYQGARTSIRTVDAVDFVNSRAYVPGTDGVLVVKSKEDEGLIRAGLSELTDDSGAKICHVLSRDEVYRGNKVPSAPQLLLIPRDDINIRTDPFVRDFVSSKGVFPRANHGPTGIFLARGPDVVESDEPAPNLMDVAATALGLLGIVPPGYFDGRPLMGGVPKVPYSLNGDEREGPNESFEFTVAEEQQIMEQLTRMGYR